ncbi:MAG: response regulator [Bacteroidota bacterium]
MATKLSASLRDISVRQWLRDVTIAKKLYFVIGIMALLITLELFTLFFAINTLSSVRAFVGAEGLYSKAQKDAVYSLRKYGRTKEEKYFQEYLQFLQVNLGDREARLALMETPSNLEDARKGFIKARNHPDDIDGMIKLFKRFDKVYYIEKSLAIWKEADFRVSQLETSADKLHDYIQSGNINEEGIINHFKEIDALNSKLTKLEDDFSYTLGDGSRWLEGLILKILLVIALTVEFTGIWLTVSVSLRISRGVNDNLRLVQKVSKSDFSERLIVTSKDELGQLASSLNDMTNDLEESINERNRIQKILYKSQKQLMGAQKTAHIGSWEWDVVENKITWSDELFRIFGLSPKGFEPNYEDYLKYCHPDDRDYVNSVVQQAFKDHKIYTFFHKIEHPDGTIRIVNSVGKVVTDSKGNVIMMSGTAQDVTEIKRIEEELIRAKEKAEEYGKIKVQFLTNMSHEIRTPMNGIIGFAKILEDSNLDTDQKENVDAIIRASNNLMVIINDILDSSKIEANKMTFENVGFSLAKTIQSVIQLFIIQAKEQQIELRCEIDPEVKNRLCGDPTRLSQILINLIGNALKFTVKGTVTLKISQIDTTESSTVLQFLIKDTGIGIEKNKLDSIFERFNQASNETTRKYGGTGLGLTITRRLIELQGGSINVKSELGIGSEFSFFLPYKRAKKSTKVVNDEIEEKLSPDFIKEIEVLLVEDNELNQLLAVKIFKKWNKEIDIAENGKVAIRKMNSKKYDIILMDIQMPEMDGYDTTRYIRENMGEQSNVPIIALTAHASKSETKKCKDMGMSDYLSKPFDPYELLKKIYNNIHKTDVFAFVATPKKAVSSDHIINLENLKDFAEGDKVFMNEIIALFLKNTPLAIKEIEEAVVNTDFEKIKKEVHKLKTSFGLFGIIKATEKVLIIEKELEKNPSEVKVKAEIKNLIQLCHTAIQELELIISQE